MTRTLTLEGEGSDDDVVIALTTQASKATPSRLVPPGMKKIIRIVAGTSVDCIAAGSCTVVLRLSGDAIKSGTQYIPLGAMGSQIPDDDHAGMDSHLALDLDIDVLSGGQIDAELEFMGDDMGEHGGVVTLFYA